MSSRNRLPYVLFFQIIHFFEHACYFSLFFLVFGGFQLFPVVVLYAGLAPLKQQVFYKHRSEIVRTWDPHFFVFVLVTAFLKSVGCMAWCSGYNTLWMRPYNKLSVEMFDFEFLDRKNSFLFAKLLSEESDIVSTTPIVFQYAQRKCVFLTNREAKSDVAAKLGGVLGLLESWPKDTDFHKSQNSSFWWLESIGWGSTKRATPSRC